MSSNRRASFPVNALRRSPRRRTKTPSVNELSKKCKESPRGKRRLEFLQEKPLKGRTFYLDLQGYRRTSSLQARIKELGGAIEEFLSKDISFVVTNRKDVDTRCSPRSNSTPSPILSVPSPFPGNTKSSSAKGSAVPSPLSADSCGAEQTGPAVPKHDMRGKALAAQAAITYKYGSSNIMANARNWGVQIVPLEKMIEKLEKYGSVEKKPTSKPLVSGRVAKQGVKPKVRKLYAPFIKVEDRSRAYKPLVHELKEWPKIYFDGPLGGCPFDSPKKDSENEQQEHVARTKRKAAQEDKNKKKGFCECCCIHYEDLDMHLLSDRHQSFARDSSNYRSLDELINKGPSLQDFLAKMLLKHEQKEKAKQEKDRSESPSTGKSSVDRDEEKTPTKKNRHETIPNCQTPPDQTPKENIDCHTPTKPFPERRRAFSTPTTDSSPEKKSTDDNTPTRVLRPRGEQAVCEAEIVESRQLRSSPRLLNSLNEKKSPGKVVDTAEGKGIKQKRLSLEKTSDETSVKRTTRAKTHSTSSSSVGEGSRRSKSVSSPSQEELIHQSPKNKRAEGKKRSPVQNVGEKRSDVNARTLQQDSFDESSGKENHDPKSLVAEDNETCSRLRSGATRLTQKHADAQEESKQDVQKESPKRTHLRSVAKANLPEQGNEDEDRDEFREANMQEEPKEDIKVESPKRKRLRSAAKANPEHCSENEDQRKSPKKASLRSAAKESLSERCNENDGRVLESRGDNVQEQDIEMESPTRAGLVTAASANLSERCSKTEDLFESPEVNVQEEPEQDIKMESPKRTNLRSASKPNLPERCSENEDRASYVPEDSKKDIHMGSPKRASLRSASKANLSEHCSANEGHVECPNGQVQEKPKQDIEMESPKRKSRRSATKGNLPGACSDESESKNTESPQTADKTLERKKTMRSTPPETKQPYDESISAKESKANKTSVGNQQETMDTNHHDNAVRLTRSRVQSAPPTTTQSCNDSDITKKTKRDVSLSATKESTDEKHEERTARSRDRTVISGKHESQKSARSSEANAREDAKTAEEHETKQSSKTFSRGSEAVPEVKITLSDCRQLCLTRNRPVLETESDESETESIQLSSEETLSKRASSDSASSDDNDISSTPTLEYCPSPASSEKSGFSDETASAGRYSLRKRADQEDQEPCPGKRTRSKCKIPDEDSKKRNQVDRHRRQTVSSAFTSVKVKSRSPKQRSQSVKSPKRKTPEKKLQGSRRMKTPLNNTPRKRGPKLKDPTSESDSSTFSGSPQSGPIRETSSTRASMVHSAVRNLEEATVTDTEDAKENMLLSDSILSLGDISTTAVCGSPSRSRPAEYALKGKDTSLSGMKLLEGSPRIKKDFHSVTFLDKRRKQRGRITRLFESDDEEEEDFLGFNVPQFDRSFSSEGDLSYKIHSIVESFKGNDSQDTMEDDDNTTIHEDEEEGDRRENVEHETETDTERSEITGEQCDEKDVEKNEEIKQVEATRVTRKRRSNQISVEVKRSNWPESQGELQSTAGSSCVVDYSDNDDDGDDFDEDDDVFSTVADSTDGEEEEQEVASPFSVTSWRRKRKCEDRQPEVDEEGEDEVPSPLSFSNYRRKRKSEDLQPPEVERPSKRRKSHEVADTGSSFQSSRPETPVKSRGNQGIQAQKDNRNQTANCFTSKLDEMVDSEQGKKAQSLLLAQDFNSFYDSDEPVFLTIEERVKLRRIKNNSRKEHDNSRSLSQTRDHRKLGNTKERTEGRLPPLKPLRKQTFKPLKPLKHASPIRSSSRLCRTNSSPSLNPSPLATPAGKSRRATWIYDVNEFTSPPSAALRFGGNRVTCSTPASTVPSSKRTLRPLRHGKMAEDSLPRKSRQRDVFTFDE